MDPGIKIMAKIRIKAGLLAMGFKPPYQIFEQLGSGSYGSVHRVEVQGYSEPFAVKISNNGRPTEKGEILFSEFSKNKENSDNWPASLAKVHAVDSTGGIVVMDYVPGLSLADLAEKAKEKGVTICDALGGLENTVSLTKSLFQSVGFLNDRDIIHRDIKGANALISGIIFLEKGPPHFGVAEGASGPSVKIIDFGLTEKAEFASKRRCGTPLNMAPEISKNGSPYNNLKVDTWALGITLMEIFNGSGKDVSFTDKWEVESIKAEFKNFEQNPKKFKARVEELIGQMVPEAIREIFGPVLEGMLVFDPAERTTMKEAEAALDSNYSSYSKKNNLLTSLSNNNNNFLSSPIPATISGENLSKNNKGTPDSRLFLSSFRNQVNADKKIIEGEEEKGKEVLKGKKKTEKETKNLSGAPSKLGRGTGKKKIFGLF
jgi:serine/threonine protein kinase